MPIKFYHHDGFAEVLRNVFFNVKILKRFLNENVSIYFFIHLFKRLKIHLKKLKKKRRFLKVIL